MVSVNNGIRARAILGSSQNIPRVKNCSFTTRRITPVGSPTVTTYNNQEFARTQLSGKILTHIDPVTHWRNPTGYRIFVGIAELGSFDYTYPLTSTVWRRWGVTPLAYTVGVGPTMPFWGTVLTGGLYLPDVNINMIHQAETECLAKLKEGAFNLAADLAELPQTFDQIATLAIRVAWAWKATSVRDYKTAAKILFGTHSVQNSHKSAAEQWLSWQYGWKPLLADIYSAFELTKSQLRKPGAFVVAKRKVTADYGLPPNPGNKRYWRTNGICHVGCEVDLWAKVSNPLLAMLDAMGLVNPLSLAWEELPFSFVIDWLAPIGTYLQAMTAPIGISFQGGVRVTKSWADFTINCAVEDYSEGVYPNAHIRNVAVWREPYGDFPFPMLYVKSPFSSTHVANAVALLNGIRTR